MPTSKQIGAYPTHLYMVVEGVLTSRTPAIIQMDTVRAAQRVRLQVYGLKGALRANPEHPLSAYAEKLTTTLDGSTLTITHVDCLAPEALKKAGGF